MRSDSGGDDGALTVALVEDDPSFRKLLVLQLQRQDRFCVVEQASSVRGGLLAVRDHAPDIALVDLTLGTEWGGELIAQLAVTAPWTMVAVLSAHSAQLHEAATIAAGAFSFYEKSRVRDLPDLLLRDFRLFRQALAGEDVLAPSATTRPLTSA